MFNEEPKEFHQIGKFFTHFQDDMDGVTEALIAGGYRVCKTLEGDMIIMAPGDYDDETLKKEFGCDDCDNDDEDEDDNDGFDIKGLPRNY